MINGSRTFRALALGFCLIAFAGAAKATTIERVVSPGGIEAWLVQDSSVPLISLEFAMRGGANQDPAAKPGVGYMAAGLLDEGAGELSSADFQRRLEQNAIELRFRSQRDHFYGSLRTLRERKDEAFELLRLSLTAPRFDAEPLERVRAQMMTSLMRETTSPNDIASHLWWRTAFPGHPYGRPLNGTLESVPTITADDLRDYVRRVLTRQYLTIAVVGDIDPATLGKMLDTVFGGLPAKSDLVAVEPARMEGIGRSVFVDLDVPQAVLNFGGVGIARRDPDFIPAYIVNHILGGGSFSSRLYKQIREERGLAYSVYSYLLPLDHAALIMGATATRSDRVNETADIIRSQIRKMADEGPTAEELDKAKSYLKGSYALNFDTSAKIAAQLVQIQLDDLGIDYINRRNGLIEAVTLSDVKRVAKRLLEGGMLFTVVGRAAKKEGG
ncbi:MAG TPA: pitrilysin family protein [Pseudorhodoplanes sp.]|nr:pitrilysin family protein [Pseudorhodoplanes sp.]